MFSRAEPWANPGTARNLGPFDATEIQVIGTPSLAYTPQRSLDGANFVPCNVYDKDGAAVTSIAAAGIYSCDGGGHLRLFGGAGSTFFIRMAA